MSSGGGFFRENPAMNMETRFTILSTLLLLASIWIFGCGHPDLKVPGPANPVQGGMTQMNRCSTTLIRDASGTPRFLEITPAGANGASRTVYWKAEAEQGGKQAFLSSPSAERSRAILACKNQGLELPSKEDYEALLDCFNQDAAAVAGKLPFLFGGGMEDGYYIPFSAYWTRSRAPDVLAFGNHDPAVWYFQGSLDEQDGEKYYGYRFSPNPLFRVMMSVECVAYSRPASTKAVDLH
jgi:hypothetical protein